MKDLREMKVDELKEIARGYGKAGIWKMTKNQLIECILTASKLNGQLDLYYDSSQELQNEPYEASEPEADKISIEKEEPTERTVESSNGWELIAKQQLKNAYDQIVGANENAVTDGEMSLEEFHEWIMNEALDEVYHEAITTMYHEDACGGPAPSEMRFAGKDFCYDYLKTLFRRDGYPNAGQRPVEAHIEPSSDESDSLSVNQEASLKTSLRAYGAWVVDRETKEVTTIVAEADSREDFYNSIKGKYRVRLITKPEKLEEECKQWEIKHARNKIKKNEKYAADKAEAAKKEMTVAEYRKWLRESAKVSK